MHQVFYSDDFNCLRELNLDNNFVSDISSLGYLSNLCALRLNHNRIESNPIYREEDVVAALKEKGARPCRPQAVGSMRPPRARDDSLSCPADAARARRWM